MPITPGPEHSLFCLRLVNFWSSGWDVCYVRDNPVDIGSDSNRRMVWSALSRVSHHWLRQGVEDQAVAQYQSPKTQAAVPNRFWTDLPGEFRTAGIRLEIVRPCPLF